MLHHFQVKTFPSAPFSLTITNKFNFEKSFQLFLQQQLFVSSTIMQIRLNTFSLSLFISLSLITKLSHILYFHSLIVPSQSKQICTEDSFHGCDTKRAHLLSNLRRINSFFRHISIISVTHLDFSYLLESSNYLKIYFNLKNKTALFEF